MRDLEDRRSCERVKRMLEQKLEEAEEKHIRQKADERRRKQEVKEKQRKQTAEEKQRNREEHHHQTKGEAGWRNRNHVNGEAKWKEKAQAKTRKNRSRMEEKKATGAGKAVEERNKFGQRLFTTHPHVSDYILLKTQMGNENRWQIELLRRFGVYTFFRE